MSFILSYLQDVAAKFCKRDNGVVALIYAVMTPMVVMALIMAFDSEQHNRYLTRVQQSQAVALQRARNEGEASSAAASESSVRDRRLSFTESWVNLNSSLSNGLSLTHDEARIETIVVTDVTNIKDYLKIENKTGSLGMIHWAFASNYFSLRIPIDSLDDRLNLCLRELKKLKEDPDTGHVVPDFFSKNIVTYCGQLPIGDIKKIPNEYRVRADQLAIFNMAKGFFPGGKGMTKTEIAARLGVSSVSSGKAYLMFNYLDLPNPQLADITTRLKTDSGFGDFYYWMQGIYDKSLPGNTAKAKLTYFNDSKNNLNKTRLFFSDWMIEDMSHWLNGKPGFENDINDNHRSVRAYFTFNGENLTKLQIKVNRGYSDAGYGTHNYDFDIQVKPITEKYGTMDETEYNNNNPDLETYTIRYVDTLWYPNDEAKKNNMHGVTRPASKKQYEEWLTEYYFRLNKSNTKIANLKTEYEGIKRTEMINAKKTELGISSNDSLSEEQLAAVETELQNHIQGILNTIHDEVYGNSNTDPPKKAYDPNDEESYEKWYTMYLGKSDYLWNGTNGGNSNMTRGAGLPLEQNNVDPAEVACRIVYGETDGVCNK